MTRKSDKPETKVAQEFRELLDSSPPEEDLHQFLGEHVFKIGRGNPHVGRGLLSGALSKFPIAPDRIPDFTVAVLNFGRLQTRSRLTFIELKKADSALYASHSRMSKDLNDAWMECVETSRLMAVNFRDCLRRIVKRLESESFSELERSIDEDMPSCNSVIVIGRRSSLAAEDIRRTRELSASTHGAIRVITYDTVLDWVSEAGEDPWSFFMRGWYW